jgi:hypothetical protein
MRLQFSFRLFSIFVDDGEFEICNPHHTIVFIYSLFIMHVWKFDAKLKKFMDLEKCTTTRADYTRKEPIPNGPANSEVIKRPLVLRPVLPRVSLKFRQSSMSLGDFELLQVKPSLTHRHTRGGKFTGQSPPRSGGTRKFSSNHNKNIK